MQNYLNLYLAWKQQQLYGSLNYRDFRETDPRANLFCSKWCNSRARRDYHGVYPIKSQYSRNLLQPNLRQDRGLNVGVARLIIPLLTLINALWQISWAHSLSGFCISKLLVIRPFFAWWCTRFVCHQHNWTRTGNRRLRQLRGRLFRYFIWRRWRWHCRGFEGTSCSLCWNSCVN